MERTITVNGTGKLFVSPDLIVVSLIVESRSMEYDKTIENASESINDIKYRLKSVGFDENALKTTDFNVRADYRNERTEDGTYKNVFNGFVCTQGAKVEFDFDNKLLSKVISVVAKSDAEPRISLTFTVKDTNKVKDELLVLMVNDATHNAEVIANACGVKLGDISSITYGQGNFSPISRMHYSIENKCMAFAANADFEADIEPENIELTDSATFVWNIYKER